MIYLKWKLRLCRIQIHNKKIWFDWEKWQKISFFSFLPRKRGRPLFFAGQFLDILYKKFQKWLHQGLEEASTWKVTKGELWISAHSESAGDLLSDGLPEPPPTWIGLTLISLGFLVRPKPGGVESKLNSFWSITSPFFHPNQPNMVSNESWHLYLSVECLITSLCWIVWS